jgi:cyanophycinase-like exopeptidase
MRCYNSIFAILLMAQSAVAQTTLYTSYFTGDTTDVTTNHEAGILLAGGATDNDEAMQWFLQRAAGGDVLVIRASGADGYNDYLFGELGVTVNSVQTLLTTTLEAANEPYVAQQIRNCEALFIAGGDQARYVNFWRNGPVEDALRYLIHEKKATIGGTSAGMAIMGDAYFSALNGTVTSAQALNNPYDTKVQIGWGDFLDHPLLDNTITDTHFDSPDRRGRLTAFLARMMTDADMNPRGIGAEEYTAIGITPDGIASVFGQYPQENDNVLFVATNCLADTLMPETCVPGSPLHWVRNEQALRAFRMQAAPGGVNKFDLNTWQPIGENNGFWQYMWVESGGLSVFFGDIPACEISATPTLSSELLPIQISPNPVIDELNIQLAETPDERLYLTLFSTDGKVVWTGSTERSTHTIWVGNQPAGIYVLQVRGSQRVFSQKIILQQR